MLNESERNRRSPAPRFGSSAELPLGILGAGLGSAEGDGTWLALLAATSVGLDAATIRAWVTTSLPLAPGAAFRLVVQSYDREKIDDAGLPNASARPRGSAQRSVSSEELRRGVGVSLVELGSQLAAGVVIAWIEEGEADLEFGSYEARPRPGVRPALSEVTTLGSTRTHLELREVAVLPACV